MCEDYNREELAWKNYQEYAKRRGIWIYRAEIDRVNKEDGKKKRKAFLFR